MSLINSISEKFRRRHFIWVAVAIVLLGIGVIKFATMETTATLTNDHITFEVQKGPLQISLIEGGTITPLELAIIKSELDTRTTILALVEEGTLVKKGDLLVELDASELLDKKTDQQIQVQNAESSFVNDREDLAVVKNQAQSDVDKAKLEYDFALQDLKKYKEGEYPNQLKEAQSKITLAKEEIIRARDKLTWSKKLFDEKYISKIQLQADELAETQKVLDLELAQNELDLLSNFTYKRNLAQLESNAKQAKMALERITRKANASIVQAEAKLNASEAVLGQRKDNLAKIERQIEKTKLYAPSDGLVVYATSASRRRKGQTEPLAEGQAVRERQHLIYLPTTSSFKAEVLIHEAKLDKIRLGMPAKITVDALPGEIFTGRVTKIAPLPNPQSAWLNPDLKVYNTDIYIDGKHESLRTGMTCKAEIIIDQYPSATYIPVQAVLRIGGEPTVYVSKNGTMTPHKVKIGLDNDRMVHILDGLQPGEIVSLTPPLKAATIEPSTDMFFIDKTTGPPPTKGPSQVGSAGSSFDESSSDLQSDSPSKQKKKKKKQRPSDTENNGNNGAE